MFASDTKRPLARTLERVQWRDLLSLRNASAFRAWFIKELARVASTIAKHNKGNGRLLPGLKWGHAVKVLTLFLRDIVYRTQLLTTDQVDRIGPLLYVPVDGRVLNALAALGVPLRAKRIKDIATECQFDDVQNTIGAAAAEVCVPRVWFDDVWTEAAAKDSGAGDRAPARVRPKRRTAGAGKR